MLLATVANKAQLSLGESIATCFSNSGCLDAGAYATSEDFLISRQTIMQISWIGRRSCDKWQSKNASPSVLPFLEWSRLKSGIMTSVGGRLYHSASSELQRKWPRKLFHLRRLIWCNDNKPPPLDTGCERTLISSTRPTRPLGPRW